MCIHNFSLTWHSLGFLSDPDISNALFNQKGTYLWLYHGSPNRIIYVGTACSDYGFKLRTAHHVGLAYLGMGYAFMLDGTNDAYDYLRKSGREFLGLINNNLFYTPDRKYSLQPWPVRDIRDFLDKVELWVCPIEDDKNCSETSKYLETQIQYVLKKHFRIGYGETDKYYNSWLGRFERHCRADLTDYKFCFEALPAVDAETKELLLNLSSNIEPDPEKRMADILRM